MPDMTLTRASTRSPANAPPHRLPWQSIAIQAAILLAVISGIWQLARNAGETLARQGTATGFGFLTQPAPFRLSESVLSFDVGQTYLRAIMAGLSNTVTVALLGILLATVVGFLVGFARLSTNELLRGLASAYVEWMRNVPLILHLSLWYTIVTSGLPPLRDAFEPIDGVFLSNRGLRIPSLVFEDGGFRTLLGLVAGIAAAFIWLRFRRPPPGGRGLNRALIALAIPVAAVAGAHLLSGERMALDLPVRSGLAIRGGTGASPEMVVLILGLALYTSAFIAEIVRAGILSVPKGQIEAGLSHGLHPRKIMTLIVLPQALRVILPPLTTQYSNLLKNSSLAVIIGYPDLVSVTNTSLNQTGQAIECIAIMMAIYLLCSFVISGLMAIAEYRTRIITR